MFLFIPNVLVYAQDSTPTPQPTTQIIDDGNYDFDTLGDCPLDDPDPNLSLSFTYKTYCNQCIDLNNDVLIPTLPVQVLGTQTPTVEPTQGTSYTIYEQAHIANQYDLNSWYEVATEYEDVHTSVQGRHLTFPEYASVASESISYVQGIRIDWEVQSAANWSVQLYIGIYGTSDPVTVHFEEGVFEGQTIVMSPNTNQTLTLGSGSGYGEFYTIFDVYVEQARGSNYAIDFVVAPKATTGFYDIISLTTKFKYFNSLYQHDYEYPQFGYCSTYEYSDGSEESVVGWEGIEIVPGQCKTIIPTWEFGRENYGEIPGFSFTTPGFSICPNWVTIDDIEIAGISLPVDIVALPAIMFLVRMIFNM